MLNFVAAVAIFNAVSVMGWCTYDGKLTTPAGQSCTQPGYMTVYETLLTGDNIYCPTTSKTTVGCECTSKPTVTEVTTEVAPVTAETPCTTDVVTEVVDCKDCHHDKHSEGHSEGLKAHTESHKSHVECTGENCGNHVHTSTQVGPIDLVSSAFGASPILAIVALLFF